VISEEQRFTEALVVNELERRYYLYLVGGEYEKLFYSFSPNDPNSKENKDNLNITRIRLEVEVTQAERKAQNQAKNETPEYKRMLDYMLKHRVNHKLESDNFLGSCHEFTDLKPFWQEIGGRVGFAVDDFERIQNIPWLVERITAFCARSDFKDTFKIYSNVSIKETLEVLGYPLFIWMLPKWMGEEIYRRLHPSLKPVLARLTSFGRKTSGAIATLAFNEHYNKKDKWILYSLAAINVLPLVLLISLFNQELCTLIDQQKKGLNSNESNSVKLSTLNNFKFSGDDLREVLAMEQIIKPFILEKLAFRHFDPEPYLLGFTENKDHISSLYFQARAFAFYKQLFKTGRIHPRETAIFLKRHKINKSLLSALNKIDLSSLSSQVALHDRFLQS
jgi:hypothetical protein